MFAEVNLKNHAMKELFAKRVGNDLRKNDELNH